ncbi:MAG: 3-oxoacyl-ACP synthase III family protein [Baekduiaceae bacterium]
MKAGVVGIGRALPDKVVTNADFEARGLETTDDWIVRRTGIRERHHLEPGDPAGALATEAAREAIEDAGIEASLLDHVIVTTITPDFVTPGLAPRVADDLGAGITGAVDLNGACAGFVYALDYAAALIEAERARTVLVVSCDILSRITDFEDRSTAVLFGDGAGAAVLVGGDFPVGVSKASLGSEYRADELYAPLGGCLTMNGRSVYTNAVDRMAEATRAVLEREGLTVDDLDLFVAHQANARILTATAQQLGVPEEKLVMNVDRVANTSSASIPLALRDAETEGRLQPGMKIGLAAFGAGYVWGANVIGWKEDRL